MRWFVLVLLCISSSLFAQDLTLFIGTYTDAGSKGIYVYRFNTATGKAQWLSNTDSARNPTYLAVSKDGKFLYAVGETGGSRAGSLSAYAFDRDSNQLHLINTQPVGGDGPCYVSVDSKRHWAVTGNYGGGSVSLLPISEDGSLQAPTQVINHEGSSINTARQEKPHVHAAVFSPDEKFLFTPDLGTDKVSIYQFNGDDTEPLTEAAPAFAPSEPGSGPRHFTFSPNKKMAYLVEELSGTVVAYRYTNGKLQKLQRISTHPKDYSGAKGSADIHLSPDGKFLYATNRGDANSIAIFSVAADGKLTLKKIQPTLGGHPRNFVIDPSGKFLLVANRDDGIVVFKRNAATGLLTDTGERIEISKPVCLKFLK